MLSHLLGRKHYRCFLAIVVLKTMPNPPLLWNLKSVLVYGRNVDVRIFDIPLTHDEVSETFNSRNEKDIAWCVNNNYNIVKNVIGVRKTV